MIILLIVNIKSTMNIHFVFVLLNILIIISLAEKSDLIINKNVTVNSTNNEFTNVTNHTGKNKSIEDLDGEEGREEIIFFPSRRCSEGEMKNNKGECREILW